jgi:glycine betaine/proline transport system permease protein
LPLAKSTILAGINQVILLALSIVIASMVGADWKHSVSGIQQNDIAKVLNLDLL